MTKSNSKTDIYKPLDVEEKDLEKAFEGTDMIERPQDYKGLLAEAVIAANYTASKDKAINIRISEKDLIKLKAKAEEAGVPYNTLVTTLIHQYNKGKLKVKI